MKLISLSANKPTFKTVNFNPTGLSLIIGRKRSPEDKGGKKTYNGIGKTLVIYLVHFCLGSKSDDKLKKVLPSWSFTLKFSVNGTEHTTTRTTDNQNEVQFDGEAVSVADLTSSLGKEIFNLPEESPFLSFRTLIKRFARGNQYAYLSYDKFDEKEEDFQKLLANGYLFGLSAERIREKYNLRVEQNKTNDLQKNLVADEVFRKFFETNSDARIERKDLEDQIQRLESHLSSFQVAEDYNDTKSEVATLKRRLKEISNEVVAIKERIKSIDESLAFGQDITQEQLVNIFETAKLVLKEEVKKEFKDLEAFHSRLLLDRRNRFTSEKGVLEAKLSVLSDEQTGLASRHTALLKYLDSHGELEEYLTLAKKLQALSADLNKLKTFQDLLGKYKEKVANIKLALEQQNVETTEYLKAFEPTLNRNLEIFRSISSRFYEDKPGGVNVTNNEGTNLLRFRIECHIEDDSASGIKEVKMFCYDAMILQSRHNHNVDFLFHDGQLFSNMDPRQRGILFQVANEIAVGSNRQYIASMNQDSLDSIRAELGEQEFERLFATSVVLTLTDDSHADKLLGVHVNLDYDP